MAIYLTGKQRIWVVIAAVWIAIWLFAFAPWERYRSNDAWPQFFVIGVGPVALVLAVIWILSGFRRDKKAKEVGLRALEARLAQDIEASFRKSVAQHLPREEAMRIAQPLEDQRAAISHILLGQESRWGLRSSNLWVAISLVVLTVAIIVRIVEQ